MDLPGEEEAPRDRAPSRTQLALGRSVLAVVSGLAFAGSLRGELVWDDTAVVAGAAQRSLAQLFNADLFGNVDGAASTANYYRPFVALGFHALRRLAPSSTWPLHAFGLVCHAFASVLVFETLRRWLGRSAASNSAANASVVTWSCWLVSFAWAVLPLKAENVAWISGVADALGFALLLATLGLCSLQRARAASVGFAALGTLLALGAKESFVVAPLFFGVEVLAREPGFGIEARASVRRLLGRACRAPEVWASIVCVAFYLCFRALAFPLRGGGSAMFEQLGVGSRVALVLESLGHALRALALPILPSLCRGPIGFQSPAVLLPDRTALLIGVSGLLALTAIYARSPRARIPLLLFVGSLLPCLNLVPAGLECRMSDRYLYVPSFAIALGVLLASLALRPRLQRLALLGLAGLGVVLLPLAFLRSLDFRSSEALWLTEVRDGNVALMVLENAAGVAERASHYEDARDLRILVARRYSELGFASGFSDRAAAVRAQVALTGPADPASYRGYAQLLLGLVTAAPDALNIPLPQRPTLSFQLASPEAHQFAVQHASSTRLELALLLARDGNAQADHWLEEGLALCPRCPAARLLAARARLAQRDPKRARELLSEPASVDAALSSALELQQQLLSSNAGSSPSALSVLAAVLGEAYPVACRELRSLEHASPAGSPPVALSSDAQRLICLAAGHPATASEADAKKISTLIQSSDERIRFVRAERSHTHGAE